MKKFVLFAAFAATMAGAKDALADECEFIQQEFASLTSRVWRNPEIAALAQQLTEKCQAGVTTAATAIAQLQARAGQIQRELDECIEVSAVYRGILESNCGQGRALNANECGRLCDADPHGSWNGSACACEAGWHTPRRNPCVCVRNTSPAGGGRRTPPPPPPPPSDLCPPGTERNGERVGTIDTDCDDVPDSRDNCPRTSNPAQHDFDNDQIGFDCDIDDFSPEHGTDLEPLWVQIRQVQEGLRTHSHPGGPSGDGLPPEIRQALIDRWLELLNVLDRFNDVATTVGDHTRQIAALRQDLEGLTGRVDGLERRVHVVERVVNENVLPAIDNLARENQRQDSELGDFGRMLADLRARVFPYLWVDGAALVFPGSGNTVVAPTAEFGLRIATFGPFAVSGSIGFGAADGEFALYFGGLGEFLLNDPNRPAHFSLGLGFAAFANEARAFGDDQYGWRGVYLEPAAFIRLGDGERAPRIRLAIRAGLGQSFWRQNAPTEWGQAGMVGASLGIAFRGL